LKTELESLLAAALARLAEAGSLPPTDRSAIVVERTRDARHGDFASNVALRLAKGAGRAPRELAAEIIAALPASPLVARTEIAGAGFINFHLNANANLEELWRALEAGAKYGRSTELGAGRKVILEFVSANPTGPVHVGTGRQAAFGATLGNLLEATGYAVHREYYINDAGRQMDILTASAWLRYLETCGETLEFPSNGYRGEYVRVLGAALHTAHQEAFRRPAGEVFAGLPPDEPAGGDKDKYVDAIIERMRALLGAADYQRVLDFALAAMLADIRNDLADFGVVFDRWYSERSLATSGAIDHALDVLRGQGRLYEKDGATWFRATEFGDDEDRVVVRANGEKTYFASDIAYHLEKRERGFELLVDVLGADHHGYVARVRGGLVAMGQPADCLEAILIQFVSLWRGEVKIPMGKRDAQFVTLCQLREEVGTDACRFFYLMRSHDQPLDFDLELAKSRSNENPVYYIQYAHARVSSVMKQLVAKGFRYDEAVARANLGLLTDEHEQAALTALVRYPEVLRQAAANRTPHTVVHYLRDLANTFHTWYNAAQFIVDDPQLRNARLALALGVQQVVRNGLDVLGVSAPETM
jgi:arginyl-tRNA synthetase